jgi:hypothetical protein
MKMSRKLILGKIRVVAASLALAGAAISSTTASAYYQAPSNCFQQVEQECTTEWQAWGYRSYEDCYNHEPCNYCMQYYHCGWMDYYAPGKPRPD